MTPFYTDDHMTLYGGDCREVLRELPAESVHCVVTSPPYWGLRDYGTATWEGGDPACDHLNGPLASAKSGLQGGKVKDTDKIRTNGMPFRASCGKCGAIRQDSQLGLEPTPEAYVANMVAVFREVRRVLRADGTLWLNLGSSFASQGGERTYGSYDGATGRGASPQRRVGAGASGRSRSRRPERAPAYGTDGTGQRGSSGPGSACSDLCDGCRAALPSRTTDTPRPLPADASPLSQTGRDSEPAGSGLVAPGASPLAAPASTTPRSETPPQATCSHCGNCGACLAVMRSPSRDARECVRTSADTLDTTRPEPTSDPRSGGTEPSGLAWGDYTSTIKPKDMVPIPWMVAMALQADGWYLRSDIIWAKPNPMPESVTDRPTKAHEYLFLLSKSARYFYDADAVREGPAGYERKGGKATYTADGFTTNGVGSKSLHQMSDAGRNLRSVWTIATEPYPGAHFATFPRRLVEPCVKAGCPTDGVVLDPFAGSGTTLLVAQALGRKAIGIDLNPDYLRQALARNAQAPLGLEVSA